MDAIAAIRLIKMYNKEVEHYLLGRKWFDDSKNEKMELINKQEKLVFTLKKNFPKANTKLVLADVCKKYFGLNSNDDILNALGINLEHTSLLEDDCVDVFLSRNHIFE